MVDPIEFPVEGRPAAQSAPSDSKASWKESVRKAVPSDAAFLGDRPLRVRIDFYLSGKPPVTSSLTSTT